MVVLSSNKSYVEPRLVVKDVLAFNGALTSASPLSGSVVGVPLILTVGSLYPATVPGVPYLGCPGTSLLIPIVPVSIPGPVSVCGSLVASTFC